MNTNEFYKALFIETLTTLNYVSSLTNEKIKERKNNLFFLMFILNSIEQLIEKTSSQNTDIKLLFIFLLNTLYYSPSLYSKQTEEHTIEILFCILSNNSLSQLFSEKVYLI